MRTRFYATDVRAMVRDLRSSILGQRVVNVYDLDSKTYLIKMANPGQDKAVLLLESGVRFHTTRFNHEKSDTPSAFSMKLRKHIKGKRLEDVRQVSYDRVVDFKFGSGDVCAHIILELYASGNIILTDSKYEVLQLLRVHSYGEGALVAVHRVYPIAYATSQDTLHADALGPLSSSESMRTWIKESIAIVISEADAAKLAKENVESDVVANKENADVQQKKRKGGKSVTQHATQAANKAQKVTLRQLLMRKGGGLGSHGSSIIDHCILKSGLKPNMRIPPDCSTLTDEQLKSLIASLKLANEVSEQLDRPGQEGYIVYNIIFNLAGDISEVYEEYLPHLLEQHSSIVENTMKVEAGKNNLDTGLSRGPLLMKFSSFDEAVDEFFGKLEEQKLRQAAANAEAAALARVQKVRDDLDARTKDLEARQVKMAAHAAAVEQFATEVESALTVIRSALENGISWLSLEELVKVEKLAGNPIANLVHKLKLDMTPPRVILSLNNDSTDDIDDSRIYVDLDVMQSAHVNVRIMYEAKKRFDEKAERTLRATQAALIAAEKGAARDLKQQKLRRSLPVARKPYWFEKFAWFITSENYLVLSGKDASQNELLVKRYLRDCDIYVHADLHGASSSIVRNKDSTGKKSISLLALQETGCATVSRSAAWSAKIVTSAWWVYANQVSKSAPTGEYLVTGSFMIRGKKNFLNPQSLEMGFAILFCIDESCVAAHANERRDKGTNEDNVLDTEDNINATLLQPEKMRLPVSSDTNDATIISAVPGKAKSGKTQPAVKKQLSAKEKKLLQKKVSSNELNSTTASSRFEVSDTTSEVPQGKLGRGKRSKQKRRQLKYADQDEEDRQIALELLGIRKPLQVEQDSEAAKDSLINQLDVFKQLEDDAESAFEALSDQVKEYIKNLGETYGIQVSDLSSIELRGLSQFDVDTSLKILSEFTKADLRKVGNKSGFLAGIMREYGSNLKQQQKEKAEKNVVIEKSESGASSADEGHVKGILIDEFDDTLDTADMSTMQESDNALNRLTGQPLATDVLLHAVPVCAPYVSLQKYKYRVKLTPGTLKKGKAAKQSLEVFLRDKEARPREKDLIKIMTDPEMVAVMLGDVKISTPGLQAAKGAQKRSKKATAKKTSTSIDG